METKPKIPFVESERLPTAKEKALWERAMKIARRVLQRSYLLKYQWAQLKAINAFVSSKKIGLLEPELPDLADRMFAALKEIEILKDAMCGVNQYELGIRMSADGDDLDIVRPKEGEPVLQGELGWVIPLIILAVVVIGIVARWIYLENEVSELNDKFDGVIARSDKALCKDPDSQTCKDWQASKAAGDYYKRETIIDSLKNAVSSVGGIAKKGLGMGLALAIPVLLFLYAPRKRK